MPIENEIDDIERQKVEQGDEIICPICGFVMHAQVRYKNGDVLLPSFCTSCREEFNYDNNGDK